MANVLGTLKSEIIIREALQLLPQMYPFFGNITTDWSSQGGALNQTLRSRIIGTPTVKDFGSAKTETAITDVPLTLTAFKEARVGFTAQELNEAAGGNRNLVLEQAKPLAMAMGEHFMEQILAQLVKAADYPNESVEALADVGYSTATKLRKVLNQRKANGQRFLALNSDAYEKFANDSLIISNSVNPKSGTVASGILSDVAGFTVYECPSLPASAGANCIGVAGRKDGVVLAVRPPINPAEVFGINYGGNLGTISATNGVSVLAQEWIDDDLGVNVRYAFIYGLAKGNPTVVQRLVTTATV